MDFECPSVFSFTSYRDYLDAYCKYFVASTGSSIREFCRRCGVGSPNYFQQVIAERRNLTRHFAEKFAKGAKLSQLETEFLHELVNLTHAPDITRQQNALTKMKSIIRRSQKTKVKAAGIHSSWLNGVLWELAKTELFSRDPARLKEVLRGSASEEDISAALRLLVKNGFLVINKDTSTPSPALVEFEPSNDIRRIDLQRSHLRFLQLAQHRINDTLADREFQGLTVAVKSHRFEEIRHKCREFIRQLNSEFSEDTDGNEVLRIQLCMFKLTASKDSN